MEQRRPRSRHRHFSTHEPKPRNTTLNPSTLVDLLEPFIPIDRLLLAFRLWEMNEGSEENRKTWARRCQEPFWQKGPVWLDLGHGRTETSSRWWIGLPRSEPCQRRMTIFADDVDYAAFEQGLEEAVERTQMRLLASCVLPNH